MSLTYKMKTFYVWKGVILQSHKFCQNANFENGGITIQIYILPVLLNNLSISLLPRVYDTSDFFEMQGYTDHFAFWKKY